MDNVPPSSPLTRGRCPSPCSCGLLIAASVDDGPGVDRACGAVRCLTYMFDDADHTSFPAANSGFADARNPFIGINDDEAEVSVATPDGERLDVGDLHRFHAFPM